MAEFFGFYLVGTGKAVWRVKKLVALSSVGGGVPSFECLFVEFIEYPSELFLPLSAGEGSDSLPRLPRLPVNQSCCCAETVNIGLPYGVLLAIFILEVGLELFGHNRMPTRPNSADNRFALRQGPGVCSVDILSGRRIGAGPSIDLEIPIQVLVVVIVRAQKVYKLFTLVLPVRFGVLVLLDLATPVVGCLLVEHALDVAHSPFGFHLLEAWPSDFPKVVFPDLIVLEVLSCKLILQQGYGG